MLIESITLQNFRQFYDKQMILFAKPEGSKNVTIIHGENGSGKTALLNAFNWCFYDEVTYQRESLLNERKQLEMKIGETADISVIIRFKEHNRKYTVARFQTCEKANDSEYIIVNEYSNVEYIDEAGKPQKSDNPKRIVEQIMPKTMSSYFFFDGERIDNLSKNERAEDVQTAIKTIMGLEMMERANKHLEKVQKKFRDELKNHSAPETQLLITKLNSIEEQINNKNMNIDQKERNQRSIQNQIIEIDQKLKKLEGAKELQEKREELENNRNEVNEQIDGINKEIISICSERGYLAFSDKAINATKDILEVKRKKGEIPSGIKKQFVEDLLEREVCICGEKLVPGSEHYAMVESWKSKAGSEELESSYIQTCANIKMLEEKRTQLFIDLKRLVKDKSALLEQLKDVIEQIEDIGDEFERDSEEIGDLERKRKELSLEFSDIDQEIGGIKVQVKQLESEKQEVESELKKSKAMNEKSELAKKRMDATEASIQVIKKILNIQADYVRERLQERIGEVYGRLLRKGYTAELDESYSINVYKPFGNDRKLVDMSTGERQITSISFLGALVDIAREQAERGTKNDLFKGGIIPIVMDSPFGSLDPDHQSRIAGGIPSLAHQIVVLVSSSQYAGIEKKIRPYVGKEYKLNYFDPKKDASLKHEYTELEEVKQYAAQG
ncbi:AAA family ATPase [Paenibacillus oleatilyticus]|uniref:AAA family ATPase n=1 Tax=Paenibacillus oleatilyticus TaxID=2594886 RepID=UPI001C1FE916|nr:AAA family ATPase [Paenibacillus oleatilyticus]MBU7315377.1 AAA family ATPase [Paenibacillus oleatilyticus]